MSTTLIASHACLVPYGHLYLRVGVVGTEATNATSTYRLVTGWGSVSLQTAVESKEAKTQ